MKQFPPYTYVDAFFHSDGVPNEHLANPYSNLRGGSEFLRQIGQWLGVEVVALDAAVTIPREQQFAEDQVEILTILSSRLYGSRRRKNLKTSVA